MSELFSLKNKVAAITGGTRGIGKELALGLAEAGCNIVLLQRDISQIDTKREIKKYGVECEIIQCDLSNIEDTRSVIDKIVQYIGGIDILINNAGIQRRSNALEFSENDWDEVISVNLKAVWIISQNAGKYMVKQNKGKIINIASLLSFQGGMFVPAYAASKGGVAQLTKALSNEWSKYNINVNAIVPGYIETDLNENIINNNERNQQILDRIPAGRWGNPKDLVGAVIYLASDASNYVNGHLLTVDGGWMGR